MTACSCTLFIAGWLVLSIRTLWRYPAILPAQSERGSLLTARVGLGMLDLSIAGFVLLLQTATPKFQELYIGFGSSLPEPTILPLDLHQMLRGPGLGVLMAGLVGMLVLHRFILHRHGWRNGRAMLTICAMLSVVLVLWVPMALCLPLRCLHEMVH
ncbi:MAG: hypothetical protein ACI8RZ_000658 [Myxococcota bacterium]|jgi:hypothetical protein